MGMRDKVGDRSEVKSKTAARVALGMVYSPSAQLALELGLLFTVSYRGYKINWSFVPKTGGYKRCWLHKRSDLLLRSRGSLSWEPGRLL